MFRDAYAKRRCLVAMTAYYEWSTIDGPKQAYALARSDRAPLFAAGLWERWRIPETGEILRSFCLITRAANDVIAAIHDRMPVFLPPALWPIWLGETPATPAEIADCLATEPPDIVYWPVDAAVGSVKNDSPELLKPIAPIRQSLL